MKQLYKTFLGIRNCEQFNANNFQEDNIQYILSAGLVAKFGEVNQTTEFVVVADKLNLQKLADINLPETNIILSSAFSVVVVQSNKNECFRECASASIIAMRCQAEALNVGSFFYHSQNKMMTDGTLIEDVVKGIFGIPDERTIIGVLSFGNKNAEKDIVEESEIEWERVCIEEYNNENI